MSVFDIILLSSDLKQLMAVTELIYDPKNATAVVSAVTNIEIEV